MIGLELRQAVAEAQVRRQALRALEGLYARVQAEIDRRRPMCQQSGRCCRFDDFGHRLYVTTLELAGFVAQLEARATAANETRLPRPALRLPQIEAAPGGGCRFQRDKRCEVHAIRPFGCRIFFCDPAPEAWQQEQYEHFHAELKRLHEAHGVKYLYVEWRSALAAVLDEGQSL